MGVFTASENRSNQRTIYLPDDKSGMAHRAVAFARRPLGARSSRWTWPAGGRAGWCRSTDRRRAGPWAPASRSAPTLAWSPDGKWMYLSVNTGDGYHIWRQAIPERHSGAGHVGRDRRTGHRRRPGRHVDPHVDGRPSEHALGPSWRHAPAHVRGFRLQPAVLRRRQAAVLPAAHESRTAALSAASCGRPISPPASVERLLSDELMDSYDISRDGSTAVFVRVDATGSRRSGKPRSTAAPRRSSSPRCRRSVSSTDRRTTCIFVGGDGACASTCTAWRELAGRRRKIVACRRQLSVRRFA